MVAPHDANTGAANDYGHNFTPPAEHANFGPAGAQVDAGDKKISVLRGNVICQ